MAVEFTSGDMFRSGADVLVCTVNCVGVMGKGVALEFKKRYPDMYSWYVQKCSFKAIAPGSVHMCIATLPLGPIVFAVATKLHWANPSKYEWIMSILEDLRKRCDELDRLRGGIGSPLSIAMPPLGCGNGQLDWDLVKPMIETAFSGTSYTVLVYEPAKNGASK